MANSTPRTQRPAPTRARPTPYQLARDSGRQALRDTVLQAAGDLLSLEGAGALTMRRIADHIGASTTVLYSLFDGKSGIVDAMARAGHDALRERVAAISPDEPPLARLAAAGSTYRANALADPARYGLMFGNAIPGHQPSQTARSAAWASFDALRAIVQECIDAGVLTPRSDPTFVSEILIAAAHGAVSLELAGHFDDAERADDRFAVLTGAALRPFLAGVSD